MGHAAAATDPAFDLDPEISALCGGPVPAPIDWAQAYLLTGCTREIYYAGLANMLLMQGVRLLAGYRPTARSARSARHLAYCEGIRTPPRRQTAEDRHRAEVARWWH